MNSFKLFPKSLNEFIFYHQIVCGCWKRSGLRYGLDFGMRPESTQDGGKDIEYTCKLYCIG